MVRQTSTNQKSSQTMCLVGKHQCPTSLSMRQKSMRRCWPMVPNRGLVRHVRKVPIHRLGSSRLGHRPMGLLMASST